ncbi:oligosaccharide flippase family protein, partial [Thiohalocapsa sp.]|uniref:oligosaccharide flippase family protein n=1 Tax=Thiohalocapsa sp. TaxID=2497641 RepID=UPI002600B74E
MSSASDISTRVGRGAALLVLGEILLRGVGLINLPILARLLGPEDFGIIAAATFVLGLSEALTRLPMGAALIRHEQLHDTHFNTAFTLTALRGLFLGAIIFASAEAAADLFRDPTVKPVLQWLAIGPILMGFENPRFVLFEKRLEFGKPAMIGVLAAAGGAILAILLALTLCNFLAL